MRKMNFFYRGKEKKIMLDTENKFIGMDDIEVTISKTADNSIVFNTVMSEIENSGVYFADVMLNSTIGYYLFKIHSDSKPDLDVFSIAMLKERDILEIIQEDSESGRKMQTNKAVVSADGSKVEIYEDDGVTIMKEFDVSTDKRTRTPVWRRTK